MFFPVHGTEKGVGYSGNGAHLLGFGTAIAVNKPEEAGDIVRVPQQADRSQGAVGGGKRLGIGRGTPKAGGAASHEQRPLGCDLQEGNAGKAIHFLLAAVGLRKAQDLGIAGRGVIKTALPVAVEQRKAVRRDRKRPRRNKIQFRQGKFREIGSIPAVFQSKQTVSPQSGPNQVAFGKAITVHQSAGSAVHRIRSAGTGLVSGIGEQTKILPFFQHEDRIPLGDG